VTLVLALVVGSVAAVLKHESSVAAKQQAFNERVASRLSHPQDEEDVLPKLRQVAETTWNSVPTN